MNEILPVIILSTLIVIALAIGRLIGYRRGHESKNAAGSPPACQPDSADYKRGV